METQRISAFSYGDAGGNPAGVVITDTLPDAATMQRIAREVGYSETAFAAPEGDTWRVRYFAPEVEVAFCGHATIALGAALGAQNGAGVYPLILSDGCISVTAKQDGKSWAAELSSPATSSRLLPTDLLESSLNLFSLSPAQLDDRLPPTLAFAGVYHAVLTLRSRADLAAMQYDFEAGRALMAAHDLTTISLLYVEDETTFVSRNAFAIGGVVEDAATGAAAAALGGALVDLGWPSVRGGGTFTIRQGEDMGHPSLLNVTVSGNPGESVRVGGATRKISREG